MERKMSFDTRGTELIFFRKDIKLGKRLLASTTNFDLWVTISIQTFYTMMDGLETLIGFNAQSKDIVVKIPTVILCSLINKRDPKT